MSAILKNRRNDPRVQALFRLTGIEMKMKQYDEGEQFIAEVERLAALSLVDTAWESPEALPTLGEIRDPAGVDPTGGMIPDRFDGVEDGLVIALSGGPDSAAAATLAREAGMAIRAIHVDHGLPGSAVMRSAATAIAAELGIDLEVVEVHPAVTTETALREARYEALLTHIDPNETLVTGHTSDDQAETVLMNLLRGAGPRGLAGMPRRARADLEAVPRSVGRRTAGGRSGTWLAVRRRSREPLRRSPPKSGPIGADPAARAELPPRGAAPRWRGPLATCPTSHI